MAQWVVCPACRHRHTPRQDGTCPRCHKRVARGGGSPAGRGQGARGRQGGGSGFPWWLVVLGLVVVAGALLLQRFGRATHDGRTLRAQASERYPDVLEPLPQLDAEAFFQEQHRLCFDQHYTLSWTWNTADPRGYRDCLERAYGDRLSKVAVLEGGAWGPHSDPRWAKLEYTARLREGVMPKRTNYRDESDCAGSIGSSETPMGTLTETAPGVYGLSTLVGLREVPCTLRVFLLYERWPLAEPLVVTTPTEARP